ncbi:MAG: CoA-binding protein [Anaerolinea sp.]|nr:CoA-binding protein [Anaerolinea sp.]
MKEDSINALLNPKSIAIVGASATPGKIGYSVIKNLLESKFSGSIYPVNPKDDVILGLQNFKSVSEIPGPVEAAVIVVPAKYVPGVIDDCGKKGVKGLIIITSGFSEVGDIALEDQIVKQARSYGMRILGPNIVGTLTNSTKLNASFAPYLPLPGKASLITQSGALLIAIDAISYTRGVGFEKLISIGNMSDVDFADLITWLDGDPFTSCISLYIEGFKDGRRFIEACKKTNKPVIALKAGVSTHGAAAAASHTGSLAGSSKVYDAAFQQAGTLRATDLNNLFDRTLALSLQPTMKGENMLVLTNGGGVGVLATDAAEKYGVPLKFAPEDVQAELKKHMPDYGSAKNPVDMTGMAGNDWYYKTVKFSYAHSWVDGLVVLYCETAQTNPEEIAKSIHKAISESGVKEKPVTISFVGGERSDKAMRWLVENGIPTYNAPDLAVNAMAALREFHNLREIVNHKAYKSSSNGGVVARKIIAKARKDGRGALTEIESKQVFAAYDLPIAATQLSTSEDEAVALAKKVNFPVVMKIVSPQILHKSDAGGVKVNIKDEAGVRDAFKTIMVNTKNYKAEAEIHGIAVQEMAPWGTETIIGSVNDATFGPTVMFGLGGIFVEVLKDVTFRVAPISESQAAQMLDEIRGAPILNGARGEAPRDKKALADVLCKYAAMIYELQDEIAETDANPVLVYEDGKGVKVVDARIILKSK